MGIAHDLIGTIGVDQLQTQYNLVFPEGIPGGGNADLITLRADTSFTPPERTVGSYDVYHKGVKITRTNMVQDMTKEFTVEIRLDQQWEVWDSLNSWMKMIYDFETGTALGEIPVRTIMMLQALDVQNNVTKTFSFLGVKIKSIGFSNGFDNQGTDPVRLSVIFVFDDMDVG